MPVPPSEMAESAIGVTSAPGIDVRLRSPEERRVLAASSESPGGRRRRAPATRNEGRGGPLPISSRLPASEGTQFSHGSASSTKGSSLSVASPVRHEKPHLRHEVLPSPAKAGAGSDLFPLARGRLSDMPYRNPCVTVPAHETAAHLRRQMLSVVFGWDDERESLTSDEARGGVRGPRPAVELMNNVDADMMAYMIGSDAMNSSDWMMLALSALGGQASTRKTAQAWVQLLLRKGDVHGAAIVLLGLGEPNDAVEVYSSRHVFMYPRSRAIGRGGTGLTGRQGGRAVDVSRLSQRLASAIAARRRWDEHAVKRGQQHLAIRCVSCTGVETCSVLTSPRAYDILGQRRGERRD
ncbi:MAG: hypothetical protein M1826_005837 [Phylliscum demangeonii]|nr:MAG: hypothetical protein M1826_005837 [Phylliscum demangeonii]